MFKTNRSLLYIAFSWLTAYMGRSGLILYAGDIDLNAPEVQDAIKAAVDEAVASVKANNSKLIEELRLARKGKTIDPAEVEKLETRIEQLEGELKTSQKESKSAKELSEKAAKALADEQGFTTKLLADNGLADALVKAGVNNPAHLKAVKALLGSQVQIVTEGDQRVAKVGDKLLADFVGEWAKSDEGKHFVAAPNHSGGGAGGGSGGAEGTKGKIDGSAEERAAHFAQKFPDLNNA